MDYRIIPYYLKYFQHVINEKKCQLLFTNNVSPYETVTLHVGIIKLTADERR